MWVLVRHGIAWDRLAIDCPPDPLRPLTSVGIEKTRAAMRGLGMQLPLEDVMLASSPYLRAMQSAEIAREVFAEQRKEKKRTLDIHCLEPLSPGGDHRQLHRAPCWGTASTRVLFGHSPDLERFAAYLLYGRGQQGWDNDKVTTFFKLKKAGAICIQAASSSAPHELFWALPPRLLRALGAGQKKAN